MMFTLQHFLNVGQDDGIMVNDLDPEDQNQDNDENENERSVTSIYY